MFDYPTASAQATSSPRRAIPILFGGVVAIAGSGKPAIGSSISAL